MSIYEIRNASTVDLVAMASEAIRDFSDDLVHEREGHLAMLVDVVAEIGRRQ